MFVMVQSNSSGINLEACGRLSPTFTPLALCLKVFTHVVGQPPQPQKNLSQGTRSTLQTTSSPLGAPAQKFKTMPLRKRKIDAGSGECQRALGHFFYFHLSSGCFHQVRD